MARHVAGYTFVKVHKEVAYSAACSRIPGDTLVKESLNDTRIEVTAICPSYI